MKISKKILIQIFTLTVFFLNTISLRAEGLSDVPLNLVSSSKPAVYSMKGPFRSGSLYFTLAPDASTVGPIYSDKTEKEYIQKTFGVLLQQAHEVAKDLYVSGEANPAYYTFLAIALLVPHHESHLMQFRQTDPQNCDQENNDLTSLRRPEVRENMKVHYRNLRKPIFPNCTSVKSQEKVRQVIFSGNKDDVGIMQINPYFHKSTVMPPYYLSLPMTANYGFTYLRRMFDSIYFESGTKYAECLDTNRPYKIEGSKDQASEIKKYNVRLNVIRGDWASYNQGNNMVPTVCRLKQDDLHDARFSETLMAVVAHRTSLYDRYLPEGIEKAAYQEILYNLKNGGKHERRDNIESVLDTEYVSSGKPTLKLNAYLKSGTIKFYSKSSMNEQNFCGVVNNSNQNIVRVNVKKSVMNWALIRLPETGVEFQNQNLGCVGNNFYIKSDFVSHTVSNIKLAVNSNSRVVDSPAGETWMGIVQANSQVLVLDRKDKWIEIEQPSTGVKGWIKTEKLGL